LFGETIINWFLIPAFAIITIAVVMIILAMIDFFYANIVVVFDMTQVTDLIALSACFSIHFAILDCRAAQVISDFHVGIFTIKTFSSALLVDAVINSSHTHVGISSEELIVFAF